MPILLKRGQYEALLTQIADLREGKARADITADWLRVRVNQLELELAQAKADLTGKPQQVARVDRVSPPNPADDYASAVIPFDDMGDAAAEKLGVKWDGEGRVKYATEH